MAWRICQEDCQGDHLLGTHRAQTRVGRAGFQFQLSVLNACIRGKFLPFLGLLSHGCESGTGAQGSSVLPLLTFQIEQLANPKAWINAATQVFFALGLGFGSLIAFASYNEPSNNCQKHAIIVSLVNSSTSIFASIVTFSIYGFKATFNYENCLNK